MLRFLCFALAVCITLQEVDSYNHFNGGSISFSVRKDGDKCYVDLDIITGWIFRKGPCGMYCQKTDVGKTTMNSRKDMVVVTGDQLYFGNWSSEYKQGWKTQTRQINNDIAQNFTEEVLAMNEVAEWEQEWMQVTIELMPLSVAKEEDIYFEGQTWHNLTMQQDILTWHIQAKINKNDRSDTGQPNRSPRVFTKPYYRVKLDEVSRIHIAATDPDDDVVKCKTSKFAEGGQISKQILPGITVQEENCVIIINTSQSLNYTDDTWGAIAVTVRDFNKNQIVVGVETIQPYTVSLGGTAVQFLVQVLEHLEAPEFVKPTADANHHFILYAGTVWKQKIYAKASENTTISDFTVMGRQREKLKKSNIQDGDEPRVKFTEIMWDPTDAEIGNHLICITAVDDTGVDSIEDRCFSIEIRPDTFNHSSAAVTDRPFFIDMPDFAQAVVCILDVTCVLPIYVKSAVAVQKIDVSKTFFKVTETGPITVIMHKGESVYQSDLLFRDSVDGVKKICLIAYDINGVKSDETCIQSKLDPPDPCASNPCKNGATCTKSQVDPAAYTCHCLSDQISGKNCDNVKDMCADNDACGHGICYKKPPPVGKFCYCRSTSGYTGPECTIRMDACTPDPCNGHGICNNATCSCFEGYTGTDCSTSNCLGDTTPTGCVPTGCATDPCNGHGVCKTGGLCVCSLGYKGDGQCNSASGNPLTMDGLTGTKFVAPTPMGGSSLTCYFNAAGNIPCVIPLYFATTEGGDPTVEIDSASPMILQPSLVGSVTHSHFIDGLTNVYTADLTVKGGTKRQKPYICVNVKAATGSSKDHRCFEISYIIDPETITKTAEHKQKTATYKFIPPTSTGETKFKCYVDTDCYIVLYTNTVSSACKAVVSGDDGVFVMPTTKVGNLCITETTYEFSTEGTKHICFKSANDPSSQTRCFYVDVYTPTSDKCHNSPCKNDGDCFHDGRTNVTCVCKPGYDGIHCGEGECTALLNACDPDAYCYSDGIKQTCICPVGKSGPDCKTSPSPPTGTKFTDTAVPIKVTCVVNRKCAFPLGVSSKSSQTLLFGYVSPHIRTEGIATENTKGHETVKATISVVPLEVGMKKVCVQTIVNDNNDDEICIAVEVTKDASTLYGRNDLPHFINPSLPPQAEVKCPVGESCHVLYHVTPGDGNEKQCTSVNFNKSPFINDHIFTSCGNCVAGQAANSNCSIDVSVVPQMADINNDLEVCIQVELTQTHLKGEERCFTITVESKADFSVKTGCQKKTCENAGFCDAHVDPPVCYCAPGFSGETCNTPTTSGSTGNTKGNFISSFGVPETIACTVNTSCPLSFHLTGPPSPVPHLSPGYVDPRLVVDGNTNVTKAPGNPGYTGTINVIPQEPGPQKICMQSESSGTVDDELCVTIQVGSTPPPEIVTDKPYFEPPTPLPGTTLLCNKGKMCNIEIQFPGADKFGSSDQCPSLEDTSVVNIEGIHIFPPKRIQQECTSHIAYLSPSSVSAGEISKICIQVAMTGIPGEERCFNMKIVDDITTTVVAPCRGKTCQNQGKCVADLTTNPATAICVCPKGFSDPSCSTHELGTTALPGSQPSPTATGQPPHHFDGETAIPKEISCFTGEPCNIPIGVKGTKPPVLGYVDPDLSTIKPKLIAGGGGAITSVSTNETGTYHICFQTTLDGTEISENIDEVCVEVQVDKGPSTPPDSSKPHFDGGTVPDNSTVLCNLNTNCHIPVYTKPNTNGDCDDAVECPPGTAGVHVFKTTPENNICKTDFVYHTGVTEGLNTVCISAGTDGEERNITVDVTDFKKFGGCQSIHCKHGGKCVSDPSSPTQTAVCVCARYFEGTDCGSVITTPKNLPGTSLSSGGGLSASHFDGKAGIPKEITCVIGSPCNIPIPMSGTKTPILGHVDPNLLIEKPIMLPGGTAVSKVITTTTTTGTYPMCIQTTIDGTENGDNVDEVCIDVKVVTALTSQVKTPDQNKPHFEKGTVPPESIVKCNTDTSCRIPVFTSPPSQGQCSDVKQCPPSLNGVHIFETKNINGTCVTDAVYRTGSTNSVESLCLTAGPGGEERNISIDVQSFTKFGPCQTKHCKNGGKCEADLSAASKPAVCVCMKGFEGTDCSTPITTPTNLPGTSTGQSLTAQTQHFDGKAGIPKEITCVIGGSCNIPIPVSGTNPPVLGYVDPNLLTGKPTILPGGTSVTKVTPTTQTTGTHKMCVQTTIDGKDTGENVDEVCVDVKVVSGLTGPIPTLDPNKPHFEKGTVPPESTVKCNTDTNCRIPVFTNPTSTGQCSDVKECPPNLNGAHVFETKSINGICVTDAVYKTGSTTGIESLCLTAGPGGEERKIAIDVQPFTQFGPCQTKHCKNGKCVADLSAASPTSVCVCTKGFEGPDCSSMTTAKGGLPGITTGIQTVNQTPYFEGNAGIPTEIKCFAGESCSIPLPYHGSTPPILGHVDPNLTTVAPKLAPGGTAVTEVTSNSVGTHKLCLQTTLNGTKVSMNVDEVCIDVKVESGPSTQPPQNKPQFSGETLTSNSKLTCDFDTSCNIPIYSKPTASGACSQVTECPPGIKGVHAFETKKDPTGVCITELVYKTTATQKTEILCISAGPDGEQRKLEIETKKFNKFGPCQTTHCRNGGKCIADFSVLSQTAVCACTKGFEGTDCNTVTHVDPAKNGLPGLTGLTTTSQTPSFDGKSGIPTEIKCYAGEPCQIPLAYHGSIPPILGHVDPNLTPGVPKLVPGGTAVTEVTSNSVGTHKICLQTTLNGTKDSVNVDEVCIDVKVESGPSAKPSQNKPHFTGETLTSNSKITCDLDTSCNIPVYSKPMAGGACPQVMECPPGIEGVHAFDTKKDPTGLCITEVVYRTPTTQTTETLCISAGSGGEQRKLEIEAKKLTKFGACQKLHCLNRGTCDSGTGTAICTCPPMITGNHCQAVSPCIHNPCKNRGACHEITIAGAPASECICPKPWDGNTCTEETTAPHFNLPGTEHGPPMTPHTTRFDQNAGLPTEVNCQKDKDCSIPLSYFGTKNLIPILGSISPGITATKPVARPGPYENIYGQQTAIITVVPSTNGKVCVQTTLDGQKDGENIDELCVDIKVGGTPPSTNPALPYFDKTNLPSGSKVICDYKIKCHIPVTTDKPASGPCPKVAQCGTPVSNLFVFDPVVQGDKCVTDVVLATTPNHGNTDICVVQKPTGTELKYSVETTDFAGLTFGPCQKLHCKNGGKCESIPGTPKCVCPDPEYVTGNHCENVSPCRGNTCDQTHGKCIVKGSGNSKKALCACENGYEGVNCDKVSPPVSHLPGLVGGPATTGNTPKYDGNNAIPTEVTCYANKPCPIAIPYQGKNKNPPILGHVGSGLTAQSPAATDGLHPGQHIAITVVTPSATGTDKVCIQTTVDGKADGTNIDEICVKVTVKPTAAAPLVPATNKPHFHAHNLPGGSTVTCNIDSSCHMTMLTDKDNSGQCSPVEQCGNGALDAAVISPPKENSAGICVTDVTYRTGSTQTTDVLAICAGQGGEKREITFATKPFTAFGLCQTLHCNNGGTCDAYALGGGPKCSCPVGTTGKECYNTPDPCQSFNCKNGGTCDAASGTRKCVCPHYASGIQCEHVSPCKAQNCNHGKCIVQTSGASQKALCACEKGYEGANCDHASSPVSTLPGVSSGSPTPTSNTPKYDGNSAVPTEVTCYINIQCSIPISYEGQKLSPPILGHVGSGLTAQPPKATDGPHPGQHVAITVVTPSATGTDKVCIQTTVDGKADGTNVDEICVNVTIKPQSAKPHTPPQTKPHFNANSLAHGSSVTCNIDSSCHMTMLTDKDNSGHCSPVEQCGNDELDAAVISPPTENSDGICVTDVTYRTGSTQTTDVLSICAGSGGEKREIRIETKPFSSFGPCQKLHCYNGGTCDAFTFAGRPQCTCPQNTTGPECFSLSTTTATNIMSSMNIGTCGSTIAKPEATNLAKKGYVTCWCTVDGKRVDVIKSNPPPSQSKTIMAAAMGAGSMTGTMVIGVVIYIVVSKVKKPRVHPRPR